MESNELMKIDRTEGNTSGKRIIIPIPSHDFDPTEVAVSWKIVCEAGHQVDFATADGLRGYADPIMLTGEGLDPWGWIPYLRKIRLLGLMLRADRFGRAAYRSLELDSGFLKPRRYDELSVDDYDGMILPGGHAPLMRQYLEDETLKGFVADFFDRADEDGAGKVIAAICHGVVLAVRCRSKKTKKSVLYGKKTTALTWVLERSAWRLIRYYGRYWDPGYYRTYIEDHDEPPGYRSVESEVKRGLQTEHDFVQVSVESPHYRLKTSGMVRDRIGDSRPAWVVRDGHYISARWPGDVHTFARTFVAVLDET